MKDCLSDCPDKLDETMTFRLPAELKLRFKKLPIEKKHVAEHKLRLVIARAVHDFKFDPKDYNLGDE